MVWTAAIMSALVSLTAAAAAVVLVVAQGGQAPEPSDRPAVDLSSRYSPELSEPPREVEIDVSAHPVYDLPMPEPVDCPIPDLDPASDASWEAFSAELGPCLNDLWRPRLKELGLHVADPEFKTTRENPDEGSPEEGMTLAYYDSEVREITIVIPNVSALSEEFPDRDQEGVWSALIGHEYGHHVQEVTGVLEESYEMEYAASSQSQSLQALRRTELQAECMGGIAMRGLGAFDDGAIDRVNRLLNGGDDLPTHGTSQNRRTWYDQGADGDTLESCNTYAAPAREVR
ncbi:neutral zinc metallopeptidase [Nocardiopsis potens]|uniref:neutral zinc metallopeptidase n=1 Tax=Nocardiopsis potens TaxID=1246458 RepID=UPI000345A334|nr:neutral zinc metallopeptidase [Nocardiopsis potens]